MKPRRPEDISSYAIRCLEALADAGLGDKVSIGGALGLLHYLEYRSTHDLDAWWVPAATAKDRASVITLIEQTLSSFGEIKKRAWGEVISIDLEVDRKKVFSFQVASRSAQLRPADPAPWVAVTLDSFQDLLASKMVALIERGAPRDFRDIHAVCSEGLVTAEHCWELWTQRLDLEGIAPDYGRARLAIETHLERIEQHRPLESIEGEEQRSAAGRVRRFIREELLHATLD